LNVAKQGFAFARVRPRTDRDPVARKINLTYIVDEGARVYIERIDVVGNTRTKDYVIRREFRLVEGDAYNPLLVDRVQEAFEGAWVLQGRRRREAARLGIPEQDCLVYLRDHLRFRLGPRRRLFDR